MRSEYRKLGLELVSLEDNRSVNPKQPKYEKDIPNKQFPENWSRTQENKGHGKTKKDTGKWCEFHKSPWHNNNECHSKQPLVVQVKDKETNTDS